VAKRTSARGKLFLVTAVLAAGGAVFAVLRGRSTTAGGGAVPVPKSGVPVPGVPVAAAAPGSATPPPAPMPTAADFPPEAPSNAVENFEEATALPEEDAAADGTGPASER
jgi:hypothetical protein